LFWQKLGLFFVKHLRFFVVLDKKQFLTIVSLKGFFRQNDVCTNIASVAYRLFDGFVSVAISTKTIMNEATV
jgi:hypothetical protein